jgi:hypothetical protein
MRAAALILILAILTTLAAGAQCIAACAQPAPPPCHHAPQNSIKSCGTTVVFEDRTPIATVAPVSIGIPAPELAPSYLAPKRPTLRPSTSDSAPPVLRI